MNIPDPNSDIIASVMVVPVELSLPVTDIFAGKINHHNPPPNKPIFGLPKKDFQAKMLAHNELL